MDREERERESQLRRWLLPTEASLCFVYYKGKIERQKKIVEEGKARKNVDGRLRY